MKTVLARQMGIVLKAARVAFDNGYLDALMEQRHKVYNKKQSRKFFEMRYEGLEGLHPLISHLGFITRFGHINHNEARRHDWLAISKDVTNLYFGDSAPFDGRLDLLKWWWATNTRRHVDIVCTNKVGDPHWPRIIGEPMNAIFYIVESLTDKRANSVRLDISRHGREIVLSFQCSRAAMLTSEKGNTLALVGDIARHFGGSVLSRRTHPGHEFVVTLPTCVRVDDYYGGRITKKERKEKS